MAVDPVCGMQVNQQEAESKGRTGQYGGKSFYFCSDDCKQTFDKAPEQYARKSA